MKTGSFCILLLCVVLTACGTTYHVSVDTLRAPNIPAEYAHAALYFVPADTHTTQDDLFFQDIIAMLRPIFEACQHTVVDTAAQAQMLVRVSYSEGEPVTTYFTRMQTTQVPVLRRGKIYYALVDEPVIDSITTYSARMLLEGHAAAPHGKLGRQLWRIALKNSSSDSSYRHLLSTMMPALREALSTKTSADLRFEVTTRDNGEISIEHSR